MGRDGNGNRNGYKAVKIITLWEINAWFYVYASRRPGAVSETALKVADGGFAMLEHLQLVSVCAASSWILGTGKGEGPRAEGTFGTLS